LDHISKACSSVFNSIFRPQPQQPEQKAAPTVLDDKKFMQRLKNELKYFEICQRVFEESYIGVVLHIQKEIQEKTVKHL